MARKPQRVAWTEEVSMAESHREAVFLWANGAVDVRELASPDVAVNQMDAHGVYHVFRDSGRRDEQGRQIWIEEASAGEFSSGR
jgi:hypothetical protein